MKKQRNIRTHSPAGLSRGQQLIACVLLVFVLFFVLNPIFECHDHMDNLRHLGSDGFLVMLLMTACAGIALTKALRRIGIKTLRVVLMSPQFFIIQRQTCEKLPELFGCELPLSLRI